MSDLTIEKLLETKRRLGPPPTWDTIGCSCRDKDKMLELCTKEESEQHWLGVRVFTDPVIPEGELVMGTSAQVQNYVNAKRVAAGLRVDMADWNFGLESPWRGHISTSMLPSDGDPPRAETLTSDAGRDD